MRRGRPTLHVVAGEGMAILAGDGLLTEAFVLLAREPRRPTIRSSSPASCASSHASRPRPARMGMVGGQAIDLDCSSPGTGTGHRAPAVGIRRRSTPTGFARMHAKKTGALIRVAAVAGAIMGGGTDAQIEAIDRGGGGARPRVSDRGRHPGRRRRVSRPRQDRRQGRRGRQADLSVALRSRHVEAHGGRVPGTRGSGAARRAASPTRACWRSDGGLLSEKRPIRHRTQCRPSASASISCSSNAASCRRANAPGR